MKTNISLSIQKPCAEKWENFTPTSNGGFCGSCNKVVVDFTKQNDDKILDFFRNKPTHACGRFRPDQLKAYSERKPVWINPGLTLLKAGLLSLLFVLVSKQSNAQATTGKPKIETVQYPNRVAERQDTIEAKIVKGIVKSADDGSLLPGVNVILKGSAEGIATDEKGEFVFPRKLKEGDVLVFTFIGLQTMEIPVQKKWNGAVEVPMLYMTYDIMGEVAVSGTYKSDRGLRAVWTKFKELF